MEGGIATQQNKYVDELKNEIQALEQTLTTEKVGREEEQSKCKILEGSVARLQKEKAEKEKNLSEKESNIYLLKKQICKLTEELDVLKSKTIVQVQILSKYQSELMKTAAEELVKKIKDSSRDSELEVTLCAKESDIIRNIPLLLLCIGNHAITLEIQKTMKDVPVSKQTAVVVIHLKVEHALPVQPSDRILTKTEFGSLGGIYDIGFMAGTGIYKCNANDSNLTSIVNFIYRSGEKKPKLNIK